jgi:DNA polymerase-3 subunit gamma/tau
MLSTSAFNALLKTLEEPPPHVYFVMATTEVQKIPATILSRCQRFDFRRIPTRVIASHLKTICERDNVKFEEDALWTIARQGDGSMRDAQSLLDQVINFTSGDLKRDLVVATLGLTDRGLLNDLLRALMSSDIKAALDGIKGLHNSGGDAKLLLLDLMEQVRNALLLKAGSDRSMVDLPDSEIDELIKMSSALAQEDLHWLFDMALKGAQDLTKAPDQLLVLEMIIMRMTVAPRFSSAAVGASQTASPRSLGLRPPNGREASPHVSAPPKNSVHTESVSTSPPAPISGNQSQQFQHLVEKIKEVNGLVGAQLENCFVSQLQGKDLTLGVAPKHKFLFEKLSQPDFKKKVLNYVTSFWGPGYTLNIEIKEPGAATSPEAATPKALAEKSEQEKVQNTRQAVEAHPLVQQAQRVFKAEIKSIQDFKST